MIVFEPQVERALTIGHEEDHIFRYIQDFNSYFKDGKYNLDEIETLPAKQSFKPSKEEAKSYGLDPNKVYEAIIMLNEDEYRAMQRENQIGGKLGQKKERIIYNLNIKKDGRNGNLMIREVK